MNDYLQTKDFPEIPTREYRIHSLIGRGAFSRVYLAYTPDHQKVAIKRLRLTQKPQALLREIDFLRKMSGKPNIVQLRQLIFSERTLQTSFVTSFLQDSVDFKQTLYGFTPLNMQAYARSLLTALSHLEPNILHRDIKPGNFLFSTRTNRGILIDFGLAHSLREARGFCRRGGSHGSGWRDSQQLLCESCFPSVVEKSSQKSALPSEPHAGTHGYRAPEVLLETMQQDCKIDVYGCGVCLLQILLGKSQLFRDSPNYDVYELLAQRNFSGAERFICELGRMKTDFQITSGAPEPCGQYFEKLAFDYNPGLLLGLKWDFFDLLRRLLEFDPKRRISASNALHHSYFASIPSASIALSNAFQKSAVTFLETQKLTQESADLLGTRSHDILRICRDDYAFATVLKEYENSNFAQIALEQNVRRGAEKVCAKYKISAPLEDSMYGVEVQRKANKCTLTNSRFRSSYSTFARTSQDPKVISDYLKEEEMAELRLELTAERRKIDYNVGLVKGMNHEVLTMQRRVRELAEELRRETAKLLDVIPEEFTGQETEETAGEGMEIPSLELLNGYEAENIKAELFARSVSSVDFFRIRHEHCELELAGQLECHIAPVSGAVRAEECDIRIACALKRLREQQSLYERLEVVIDEAEQSLAFSDRKFTFYSARFGDFGYYKEVQDIKTALDSLNSEIYSKQNKIKALQCERSMVAEDLLATEYELFMLRGQIPITETLGRARARDVSDDLSEHADSLNSRLLSLEENEMPQCSTLKETRCLSSAFSLETYESYSDSDKNDYIVEVPSGLISKPPTQENVTLLEAFCDHFSDQKSAFPALTALDFDLIAVHNAEKHISPLYVRTQEERTAFMLRNFCFSPFHLKMLSLILQAKYQPAAEHNFSLLNTQIVDKYYRSGLARKDAILAISACESHFDSVMDRPPDLGHILYINLLCMPRRRSQSFIPGVPKSLAMRRFLQGEWGRESAAQVSIQKRVDDVVAQCPERPCADLRYVFDENAAGGFAAEGAAGSIARGTAETAETPRKILGKTAVESLKRINEAVLGAPSGNKHVNEIGSRMLECITRQTNPALSQALQQGIDQFGGDLVFSLVRKVVLERQERRERLDRCWK